MTSSTATDTTIEQCPTCGADCTIDEGVPISICYCGKGGQEKTAADAPCHYNLAEAEAWANGYNAAYKRS